MFKGFFKSSTFLYGAASCWHHRKSSPSSPFLAAMRGQALGNVLPTVLIIMRLLCLSHKHKDTGTYTLSQLVQGPCILGTTLDAWSVIVLFKIGTLASPPVHRVGHACYAYILNSVSYSAYDSLLCTLPEGRLNINV